MVKNWNKKNDHWNKKDLGHKWQLKEKENFIESQLDFAKDLASKLKINVDTIIDWSKVHNIDLILSMGYLRSNIRDTVDAILANKIDHLDKSKLSFGFTEK